MIEAPDLLGELRQQPVERLERDPRLVADRRRAAWPSRSSTVKSGCLVAFTRDGDDHPVGEREAAAHQVLVALRRRIERARVERDPGHGAWQKVRAVSP